MAELSDLAASCIRCGFCLESCPTFVVTGAETESPRGRIYLARSLDEGIVPWSDESRAPLDSCVGCRACETACPSGVQYGHILEIARSKATNVAPPANAKTLKVLLDGMSKPWLFRIQVSLAHFLGLRRLPKFLAKGLSSEPQTANIPAPTSSIEYPTLDQEGLPPIKGTVYLLQGCAMSVLYPDVHEATERLLRRVGFETISIKGCCGALHAHNGFLEEGKAMRTTVTKDFPIVANSAGCGSWLKDGSGQVFDITEFLIAEGLADRLSQTPGINLTVAYHDACHLSHGQRITDQPRALLQAIPGLKLVPVEEANLCCGSGGVYNLLQPVMARKLGDRKWRCLTAESVDCVVTGNPGCQTWLDQISTENGGTVQVLHTISLLEAAFSGYP